MKFMEKIKDPRDIYTKLVQPAEKYIQTDRISHSMRFIMPESSQKNIELIKNSITLQFNPLLEYIHRFDEVTIEQRALNSENIKNIEHQKYLAPILYLVTEIRKATIENIRRFVPSAIEKDPKSGGLYYSLDDHLKSLAHFIGQKQEQMPSTDINNSDLNRQINSNPETLRFGSRLY